MCPHSKLLIMLNRIGVSISKQPCRNVAARDQVSDEELSRAYDYLMNASFGLAMTVAPKATADIVESLAGAILVDSDFQLEAVFEVITNLLFPATRCAHTAHTCGMGDCSTHVAMLPPNFSMHPWQHTKFQETFAKSGFQAAMLVVPQGLRGLSFWQKFHRACLCATECR